MPPTMSMDEMLQLRDQPVYSNDGEKIGKVEDIYYDDTTRQPEWLGLGTGFFGTKHILVPVEGLQRHEDGVRVPYPKDKVQGAPDIDSEHLSQEQEDELLRYYGAGGMQATAAPSMPHGEAQDRDGRPSLVCHEEELVVDTSAHEIGAVRARKRVEEHTEKQRVPREIEQLGKVERVSAEAEDSGQIETLPDGSISISLLEEQIVVTKRTVVRERVILRKQVKTEQQKIEATLRKERVEVTTDGDVELLDDEQRGQ